MKLIKINPDHYVIVNDSPIEEGGEIEKGDWYYLPRTNYVYLCEENPTELNLERHCGTAKVTHSTQPLYKNDFWAIQELKLSEVKELIGEVDVVKKAEEIYLKYDNNQDLYGDSLDMQLSYKAGVVDGYNQALEDNKEKIAMFICKYLGAEKHSKVYDNIMKDWEQSLQPETEWEVEFVDGKLKLKS